MITDDLYSKILTIQKRLVDRVNHTVALGQLDQDNAQGIVIAAVPGNTGFAYHLEKGFTFPLHTSAPGKVLLAWNAPDVQDDVMQRMTFERFTPSTITDQSDFRAELKSALKSGYAVDASEQLEGCHCVSIPVFDHSKKLIAALWTTGPANMLPLRDFDNIALQLKSTATEITQLLKSTRMPNRDHINRVVEQAKSILADNLQNPPKMEELAANLYISYSWFRSVFKEQTGMAPGEYHQQLRLEKAKQILDASDLSIRQVSEILGFSNQNHFSALFKRKTGLSPANFRNR